jgi:hypothetical protein
MEYLPHFPDLSLNDFWLFPKIKSSLKDKVFRILKTSKKYAEGTENSTTTGVP